MHVRICRDCGEEFRPEIARCTDCGGELVDHFENEEDSPRPVFGKAKIESAPEEEDGFRNARAVVSASHARDLVPVADALVAANIPFRIVPSSSEKGARLDLFVRDEDSAAALETLAPLRVAGVAVTWQVAQEDGFMAAQARYARCPACDAELRSGLVECPECGLAVGGGVEPGPVESGD